VQAVQDGVDIISLSIGPSKPTEDTLTFLSIFDITLLFARKAGVFVAQAAGNSGPSSSTVVSFSPWSVGVASIILQLLMAQLFLEMAQLLMALD
jgi:hypothetical protein